MAKSVNPLTLLASAQGTLEFKAPEAFEDQDTTGGDIWSLGVTLYLLLTDHVPYPQLADRGVDALFRADGLYRYLGAPSLESTHVENFIEQASRPLALVVGDGSKAVLFSRIDHDATQGGQSPLAPA